MPIRIMIAEDQRIVREGLIALLEDEHGYDDRWRGGQRAGGC